MDSVYYVSIIAQFLTYASFLSGAKVCHILYRQRSSAKLSPMPFLAGLNCTALWLRYGFIADEWEIIAVNIIGLACQVIYLAFFVVYARSRARLIKQLAALLVLLLLLFWCIQVSDQPLLISGTLASLSSTIACASPLATIQDVLKTRCVSSLPFPIIISSFVVSLSWFTYGYLKGDNFIIMSNIIALAIGGAQLTLFAIYPSKLPYEKLSPSNKKSYDLIKLLNSDDDELELFDVSDNWLDEDQIDTNQDYKETLTKIMGEIYSKRVKLSKNSTSAMLSYAN